jgi:aldehyde dehydrogenase (NAD+)
MDPAAVVQDLRNTFNSGRTRPIEWRQQQLKAVKRMVRANEKAFCDALNKDLGKPHFETMIAEVRGVYFLLLSQNDLQSLCNW